MSDWYLAKTKTRQESIAKVNLERQGYETFLPMLAGSPLFDGYIFVRVIDDFAPIQSTRGVTNLVRFGQQLATVPERLVELYQKTEWARSEECAPGSKVRITNGPFNHLEAIVKAKKGDRIFVLLELLGRKQQLSFSTRDIVAA